MDILTPQEQVKKEMLKKISYGFKDRHSDPRGEYEDLETFNEEKAKAFIEEIIPIVVSHFQEDCKQTQKLFTLFQTDVWKTKSSRIFLGIFSSHENAVTAAKANDCYRNDCEVDIIETNLDEFNEL